MPSSPQTRSSSALIDLSVTRLKGVGPQLAEKLSKLDIYNMQDLLFHLPYRYEDRTRISLSSQLRPGESAVLEGEMISCNIAFGRRRSLLCKLRDQGGVFSIRFYHFSRTQQENLARAKRVRCYGEMRRGATGLELYHPEYTLLRGNEPLEESLTPIYPLTEGISQARLRLLINQVLDRVDQGDSFNDLLRDEYHLGPLDFSRALMTLHRPLPNDNTEALMQGLHPAQKRLAFEELVAHHAAQLRTRAAVKRKTATGLTQQSDLYARFVSSLPFTLTAAQIRVLGEIDIDLQSVSPMQRLLQGDVGSGKTVVAALSAVRAMANGVQTAIMAPTEILAEQHYLSFTQWLGEFGVQIAWLSSKVKGKKRNAQLELIRSGSATIVIGTHALIQEDVDFHHLGLVIIDEQHRFGVNQRLSLLQKGNHEGRVPHQLFMTATPIPRTLAMSLYADMDTSVIDESPPGRKEISTLVLSDSRRSEVIDRVHVACRSGAQAYWVCTLIDESETLAFQAAEETARQLENDLADIHVALIHGRMSASEKTATMQSFKRGDIQLLVSTTVIEVGVDVPNASLMVIENAERLGLAQLHQLRGRVGRGKKESHCLLMYHSPVSQRVKDRLHVMRSSTDGFFIAEEDLRIRGPGEVIGQRQSGELSFRVADLGRDADLLPEVNRVSRKLMQEDPDRIDLILKRWLLHKMDTHMV